MKCPHLIGWGIAACKACDEPYVPSLFELNEYCNGVKHEKCPLYGSADARGAAPII